jgi:hypothetical protein
LTLQAGQSVRFAPGGRSVTAGNDLKLAAFDLVQIDESTVSAGNKLSISAGRLLVTGGNVFPTQLVGQQGATITVDDVVGVGGGAGTGAFAEIGGGKASALTVAAGSVFLQGGAGDGAYARLVGDPHLNLTITNGQIHMFSGPGNGAYAGIASVSPNSIYVNFPFLLSGGYFINKVESVVFDPVTASGFVAGGLPAIPDKNLIITYGQPLPPNPPSSPNGEVARAVQENQNQVVTGLNQVVWPGVPDQPSLSGTSAGPGSTSMSCSDGKSLQETGACIVR